MRVKVFAVERCLDLAGIGAADGRDHIRIGEAAFEHVCVFIALFKGVFVEDIIRETGPVPDGRNIVYTLETEIMDRDHGLGTAERSVLKERTQIDRYKARLPVMAVDHIRDPVHIVKRR